MTSRWGKTEKKHVPVVVISTLMGLFLNQSAIVASVNVSMADCLVIALIMHFFFCGRGYIPIIPFLFFCLLSIVVFVSSTFIVPLKYDFFAKPDMVLQGYLKLIVVFVYLTVGYSLRHNSNSLNNLFNGLFAGTLVTAIFGTIYHVLKLSSYYDYFFVFGTRFRGFMNDPNYFSIIQVCGIVYILNKDMGKTVLRWILIVLLVFSILLSGSKTGIVIMGLYFIFFIVRLAFRQMKTNITISILMAISIAALIVPIIIPSLINDLLVNYSHQIPNIDRIEILLRDFNQALTEGGSGRKYTWGNALYLIKNSPLLGIGVGIYSDLSNELFGTTVVAHSTFLQLAVEWGIVLSSAMFIYLGRVVYILNAKGSKTNSEMNYTLADILLVFLLGSIAISLNNARLFWIVLGGSIANLMDPKRQIISIVDSRLYIHTVEKQASNNKNRH